MTKEMQPLRLVAQSCLQSVIACGGIMNEAAPT
jgi:hypothetical protein